MRQLYLLACTLLCTCFLISCQNNKKMVAADEAGSSEKKKSKYDAPFERALLEFEKTKDPALGYVPYDRLMEAMDYTEQQKQLLASRGQASLLWVERGPIYDTIGPSNGNSRAGVNYTAGRVRAILVDTLNDPSGNTVIAGGVAGGLWKCTNFLSAVPNWQPINDYFDNLAISYIAQDPSNPSVMYFCTGEGTSNADAVLGRGMWKSTDAGNTWNHLPTTANYIRSFRILCDNNGYVYAALRTTASPAANASGLVRSKDGGATWQNITPTLVGTATATATCTDLELSSTGKMYASFGYATGAPGTTVRAFVTNDPANVTQATWTQSTGIRPSGTAAIRMELDAVGDVVYAVTVNTGANTDSCYMSVDGGVTFTKRNTTLIPSGLGSGQGWYNQTLTINPYNVGELMSGGLDAYRSLDSGRTWVRSTFWITTTPYVHADHHFMQWWRKDGESRILIGCDGGLFLSRDNGVTWKDKNRNLAIKQFYSAAIHPTAGSPYLIGGTQDNGVHQLKYEGLGPSIEVTGGDGCYTHINQLNGNIQFGSYVFNQYRRSTNGGQTWTSVNLSSSQGLFVNPFDYDDANNIMYASNGVSATPNRQIRRWNNPTTGSTSTVLTLAGLLRGTANSNATAFKVSPYTANRVFIGGSTGKLLRLDNANTVTAANVDANVTDITGASFQGFLNCVNTGSSDQVLVAVFSNFGINNVWYTTNGGTSWTAIDGNLPDMPVRWAIIVPGQDDQIILATEAGIYSTTQANGASTVWMPNPGFPTVRTDMLKLRTSDNTVVAATHGRGLFTATISMTEVPEIRFVTGATDVIETSMFNSGCRGYNDYVIKTGIINPPTGDAVVTYNVQAGSTALRGVDFDFTTNGSFTSPSDQHVYSDGETAVKEIKVRIYDDAEIEAIENFTIGFTISGTTNAVAGEPDTHTFTIEDNGEEAPHVSQNLTATFGVNDILLTQPFRGQFSDARTQIMYLASELKAAGFRKGYINSIAFNVIEKFSTAPYNGYTIKMKNSASGGTAFGTFEGGASVVYGPVNYSTVVGQNTFTLTTPFLWDGVSNLLVDICYDNTTGTATDNVAGTNNVPNRCHFDRVDNASGCSLPSATFQFTGGGRPDATFNITTIQTPIATALNSQKTEHLDSYNDIYYYNEAGEVIARVKNLTGHDYGCTQVVIDRAGTGATRFWNNNKKNYLAYKTFRVLPSNGNPSGKYEITLYFTKEEKEGWERETGNRWSDIQIVKTSGRISDVTPQNSQPNNNGTVQTVANPVRGTFGTGYTLTFTFENGFGGFGAGTPGRQFNVLIVSANHQNQNRGGTAVQSGPIDIKWTAETDADSRYFDLEKSYDGVNFQRIARIPVSQQSEYNYTDNSSNSQINYYRITLTATANRTVQSNVVKVMSEAALQKMYVLTNPFSDQLRVRFDRVPSSPVAMNLYDAQGRLVASQRIQPSETVVMSLTTAKLSAGVYSLNAVVDGKQYKVQLLKR